MLTLNNYCSSFESTYLFFEENGKKMDRAKSFVNDYEFCTGYESRPHVHIFLISDLNNFTSPSRTSGCPLLCMHYLSIPYPIVLPLTSGDKHQHTTLWCQV